MSSLSTHVLDTTRGRPADGLTVVLSVRAGERWTDLVRAVTGADGRIAFTLPAGTALARGGTYRLRFDTGAWFATQKREGFYPHVDVVFVLQDDGHHHVPLLISPFGYSTYRGS
jgi:5-hydroxyisourate hydrolase